MKQYECDLCGYVYDEAAGDPTTASPPGTKWGRPARRLGVPLCGAGKDEFTAGERVPRPTDAGLFLRRVAIRCGKRLSGLQCGGLWAGPAAAGSPE